MYHTNSYCIKAIISDVTGSALLTCFSPEADSFLPPCTEVLSYIPNPNPYRIPPIIIDLEHTKRGFDVHFGVGSRRGFPKLVLDHASDADPPMLPPVFTQQTLATSSAVAKTPDPKRDVTKLSLEKLTPPLVSSEPAEKKEHPKEAGSPNAKKQLFEDPTEEADTAKAKRPKIDDPPTDLLTT